MSAPIVYSGDLFMVRHEEWFEVVGSDFKARSGPTARPKRRRTWTDDAMRECLAYMKASELALRLAGSGAAEAFDHVNPKKAKKRRSAHE